MKKDTERDTNTLERREFIKTGVLLGTGALLASQAARLKTAEARSRAASKYAPAMPENIIYSTCLQCHTACPIKAKVVDGVLVKIDGNPYSPQSLLPHIHYRNNPVSAAVLDGYICPKGQAGIQSAYDPYRIRKVLKRAGKRGENKWVTIDFEQAIDEIINGGYLFKHVDGEEERSVTGLKDLFASRNSQTSLWMASDAKRVASGKMPVSKYKARYQKNLDTLIDPEHPDLGPKNNQFVFMAGRIEHGRKEFSQRWLRHGFGSVNWYEHTTICEQSHHIAYKQMTRQFRGGKWLGGKTHMKPDTLNSEFIIYFGTSGGIEAGFGPPPSSRKITGGIDSGQLKTVVVDPRFNNGAAKAWKWLPIKPGTDGALAMAIISWIIYYGRFDRKFLRNATRKAAVQSDESSWSTASLLVKIEDGRPTKYLRASEIGIGGENEFVVFSNGIPTPVDINSNEKAVFGDLFANDVIKDVPVKTALQLLKESAFSKSFDEYAKITHIKKEDIVEVAREFTSHGKKAAAEFYRGAVQHTNGYYNAKAIIALNALIGNQDWKGGLGKGGGHWHEAGDKPNQPFPLKKSLHPGKIHAFGHKLTREKSAYEKSTLFDDYPAKRPWFPFTDNVYQEVLPSAVSQYPYGVKVVWMHMATPALSTPGANAQLVALQNLDKIPLLISTDIVIGDSTVFADYVFPDTSIWERWGLPHVTPDVQTKTSKVRQPIIAPIPETVTVFERKMPICMESVMLKIAEKLGLPGYGKNGFKENHHLEHFEDYYLRMVANIAWGDKHKDRVRTAGPADMDLFMKSRQHLPKSIFEAERWQKVVGNKHWRRALYVLLRGGRFENFERAYKGEKLAHAFSGHINLYVEPVGNSRNSMSGEYFSGTPVFVPDRGITDVEIRDTDNGYPLTLITYKNILGGQSRTLPNNYWLSQIWPENHIELNPNDAEAIGVKDGDTVRIVSATNPDGAWSIGTTGQEKYTEGRVKLTQGLKPGVVSVSWHFGHWAYGASDMSVDGKVVKGEERRATGLCPNAVMRHDPHLGDVCLTDPIGGSAAFFGTAVKLVKA
ncbi:MAG: molybdopterin-dependent oxidoreductase [Candidatus Brocadiales bacterium]